ncbi:MAG: sugar ABC transporter permease [Saccharofermentans sp.]|nr:sugar ABC transporter permease [Saccharofermentans sp.]
MANRNNISRHYTKWGYIFVLPFLLIFLVFNFYPLLTTVYYAFCDLRRFENPGPRFLPSIGEPWYRNFQQVFEAKSFHDAFRNTMLFFVLTAVPEWIIAFWLAAAVTDRRLKIKGRTIYKTAFIFPKLIEGSALSGILLEHLVMTTAMAVGYVYMAMLIDGFGITVQDIKFFLSIRFLIIVVSILMHFGITFIYAVAGITSVPVEIFEAAEMDGANRLQTFFRVTIPCMKPVLFFISVVTLVDGLGMFNVPSSFGLFDSLRINLTMMQYIMNQAYMGGYIYDRASAASLILLAMCGVGALIIYFIFIRDKDEARLRKLRKKELREAAKAGGLE